MMDKRIINFISEEGMFTLCTSSGNIPYCSTCFYAFDPSGSRLVFKSSPETRHVTEALENSNVAGTINPSTKEIGKIRGIQFSGKFIRPEGEVYENLRSVYYSKYPVARVMPGELWAVELEKIKMTDNTLVFGKKIFWEKENGKIPVA